mgnify:CR=1 FL=1
MSINWLEWLGYLSSIIVAISLLMSSIVKLRLYNLVGSILFSAYGFAIQALPVGFLNGFIALINVYYLFKIYSEKEYFKLVEIPGESQYLSYFLEFYHQDIKRLFPNFQLELKPHTIGFYVLRNLMPAGIFIASKLDEETLLVDLDFVVPEYRDFKVGKYIFQEQIGYFLGLGYKEIQAAAFNEKHRKYLKRMGFQETKIKGETIMVKSLK